MRFHTDALSIYHFAHAAQAVGANLKEYSKHGSDKRDHSFHITFGFSLSDRRSSATWNQVGAILAQLFELDPEMFVGSGSISQGMLYYDGKDDFHDKTANNFLTWNEDDSPVNPKLPRNCLQHKWDTMVLRGSSIYHHLQCSKCGIDYFQNGSNATDPNAYNRSAFR